MQHYARNIAYTRNLLKLVATSVSPRFAAPLIFHSLDQNGTRGGVSLIFRVAARTQQVTQSAPRREKVSKARVSWKISVGGVFFFFFYAQRKRLPVIRRRAAPRRATAGNRAPRQLGYSILRFNFPRGIAF